MTYHRVCNQNNTTGVASGAGSACLSGALEFTPGFQWGSCYSIFSFIHIFCRSLFFFLYFFFWPMCWLFLFDLRILITPQVSSNTFSYLRCLLLVLSTSGRVSFHVPLTDKYAQTFPFGQYFVTIAFLGLLCFQTIKYPNPSQQLTAENHSCAYQRPRGPELLTATFYK